MFRKALHTAWFSQPELVNWIVLFGLFSFDVKKVKYFTQENRSRDGLLL
jgi:hypothetical protein